MLKLLDRVTSRFFRFEVEEDELQTEMTDHLDRARQIIKKGKQQFKMDCQRIMFPPVTFAVAMLVLLPSVNPSMPTPQTSNISLSSYGTPYGEKKFHKALGENHAPDAKKSIQHEAFFKKI